MFPDDLIEEKLEKERLARRAALPWYLRIVAPFTEPVVGAVIEIVLGVSAASKFMYWGVLGRFVFCPKYRSYRKYQSGKWELWWNVITKSPYWFKVEEWTTTASARPHCTEGERMGCEDWVKPEAAALIVVQEWYNIQVAAAAADKFGHHAGTPAPRPWPKVRGPGPRQRPRGPRPKWSVLPQCAKLQKPEPPSGEIIPD